MSFVCQVSWGAWRCCLAPCRSRGLWRCDSVVVLGFRRIFVCQEEIWYFLWKFLLFFNGNSRYFVTGGRLRNIDRRHGQHFSEVNLCIYACPGIRETGSIIPAGRQTNRVGENQVHHFLDYPISEDHPVLPSYIYTRHRTLIPHAQNVLEHTNRQTAWTNPTVLCIQGARTKKTPNFSLCCLNWIQPW